MGVTPLEEGRVRVVSCDERREEHGEKKRGTTKGAERSDEWKVVNYVEMWYNSFCCRFAPAVALPHLVLVLLHYLDSLVDVNGGAVRRRKRHVVRVGRVEVDVLELRYEVDLENFHWRPLDLALRMERGARSEERSDERNVFSYL